MDLIKNKIPFLPVFFFCLITPLYAGDTKSKIEKFGIEFTKSDSAEFIKWMYSTEEITTIVREAYEANKRRKRWKQFGVPAGLGLLGLSVFVFVSQPECDKQVNPDCSGGEFENQFIGAASGLGGVTVLYFSIRAFFKKTAEERMLLNKCYFGMEEHK
jgi:hypothetical protein